MRGVGGACKHMQCPLLHSAKVYGLATSVSTPQGPENNWVPLHTPASACIPIVAFPSCSSRMKKWGEQKKDKEVKKGKTWDRTSLAALYSMHWGRSHH
jgi:hypothetical protein